MNLRWTVARLRAMGPAEIAHRIVERTKRRTARRRREGWGRYDHAGPTPILPGLRKKLAAAGTAERSRIAEAAAATLAGDFSALGRAWPRRPATALFPEALWQLDPVTGRPWPGRERYCFDIAYRHERALGDVKYVWELNRLQFLQPLAAQVFLKDDGDALAAIEDAVTSWHAANPPFRGVGWASGIEVALRAISLLSVSTLAGGRLSARASGQIRAVLGASAFWLARFPSRFSSANNHRIAEAAGLFMIALAMPDLPRATEIECRARRILEREALKQFHPDGVPAEQSPAYGAFSAELLLSCAGAATAAGRPLSAAPIRRLDAFATFVGWISDPSGRTPSIGDDDEGRVLTFAGPGEAYATCVAAQIAGGALPRGMKTFAAGGYTAIVEHRDGHEWRIVFDHGPLGYLAIAAHGHADALSLAVSLDGAPLIVDPGTYLYHSGGQWRDWFRGTRAHSTVAVAGADQSCIAGPFNWSAKARARLEEVRDGPDWKIVGSHDGYARRFGVVHRRTLTAEDSGFRIHDVLLGRGAREVEIVFQLAPDCVARNDGQRIVIARAGADVAALSFDAPRQVVVCAGGDLGEGGWVSPTFGARRPAPRIVWRGTVPENGIESRITTTRSAAE